MILARLMFIVLVTSVAACGRDKDLTCDEANYKSAVRGPQIDTPPDLDDLDPLKEMPLPQASPQPVPPAGSPCLDIPPEVRGTN